jgi:arylsulfatase A-like enzyme
MRLAAAPIALALALLGCGEKSLAPGGAHNVILISLDTLRADHLGCYGRPRNPSPTIDALAAAGVRFADASSAAPWTLPSHATMFTGLYPSRHGVFDYEHRLPQERVTLAEALSERGYETYAVLNTWSLADPRFELLQGFAPERVRYVPETESRGGEQRSVNSGPAVAAAARDFLAARDASRPFFLFLHFFDAHTDFTPRPEYKRRFLSPYAGAVDGTTRQLLAVRAQGAALSEADVRHLRELYDAEIRQLDDVLAGFFAEVEARGLLRDTLIVLTSDHGEEFQEHGGLLHGRTQYQELLAVPLILRGPGLPRGRVVTEPVSLVDLAPTILAALGLPPSGEADGIDLSPSWAEPARPLPERLLFGEADHNNVVDGKPVVDSRRMARRGSEKLHLDRFSRRAELYDLARDPGEHDDLAARSAERTAALSAGLGRHLEAAARPEANQATLSDAQLELLRSLGYVESDEER